MNKNIKGYTLIEAVIVMAVFAITSVIVSNIYLQANNLQKQTENMQRLQNQGRYILEKIAKEVRERDLGLPYTYQNPTSTLKFLLDEDNNQLTIEFKDNNINYVVSNDGIANSGLLNEQDNDVRINDLKFFVFPTKDSMGNSVSPDLQPRVTAILKLQAVNSVKYPQELVLQTTISSKRYNR